MGFKPKFHREAEITEPEEEKLTEEIEDEFEDELPVPSPQPKPKMNQPSPSVQKTQPSPVWEVQDVSTETQPFIYNSKSKKYYNLISAIAELLNRTE